VAFDKTTEIDANAYVGQSALLVAIDPVDGSMQQPSQQQHSAFNLKRQTQQSTSNEFKYRDTLTVHADGTKSGVVNPQFLHSIQATRTADGTIVLHESKAPVEQQLLEVE